MIQIADKHQLKAIHAEKGAHLVIASAGSGKTFTIIQRSIHLIKKGICKPEELLLLTFSRKAAEELQKRIVSELGSNAEIVASTFHAFCLHYILKDSFKEIHVLDEEASKSVLTSLIHSHIDLLYGFPVFVVYKFITTNKKYELPLPILNTCEKIKNEYIQYKKKHGFVDYDDMINVAIELLQQDNSLRSKIVNKFKYVMVDEFQDTSENNYKLLRMILPDEQPNVFLVGDDWQSIYKFRDARVEYIVKAKKYFNNITVHMLSNNYRSKKEIVQLSNRLIKKNKFRSRRRITSVRGKGGKVSFHQVNSFKHEAIVAGTIAQMYLDSGQSIGVLYRNNWQGNILQGALNNYDEIQCMTIHAAKGLEFDVVILCGVKDKVLPDPYTDIEEERRLMYVALTRAKNCLHILYHLTYDNQKPQFVKECEPFF